MTFDDTSTNAWLNKPGPIHLRRIERKPDLQRNVQAATGIVHGVVIGAAILPWLYLAIRMFW